MLPAPIVTDESGQQVKRYLAFINNDKVSLYNAKCVYRVVMIVEVLCSQLKALVQFQAFTLFYFV